MVHLSVNILITMTKKRKYSSLPHLREQNYAVKGVFISSG